MLCIESQPKTARTITRSAKRFQKKTFSEIKEEIDKLVLVGKIDQSTAALLMLSAHCQKINVGVNGIDIHTDQVQKEYGLGDDENPIKKLAFPELQRVAEATNQLRTL